MIRKEKKKKNACLRKCKNRFSTKAKSFAVCCSATHVCLCPFRTSRQQFEQPEAESWSGQRAFANCKVLLKHKTNAAQKKKTSIRNLNVLTPYHNFFMLCSVLSLHCRSKVWIFLLGFLYWPMSWPPSKCRSFGNKNKVSTSGQDYSCSTDFLWTIHPYNVEFFWTIHPSTVEFFWTIHPFTVEFFWTIHPCTVEFLWTTYSCTAEFFCTTHCCTAQVFLDHSPFQRWGFFLNHTPLHRWVLLDHAPFHLWVLDHTPCTDEFSWTIHLLPMRFHHCHVSNVTGIISLV